jgi:hypothetical protein
MLKFDLASWRKQENGDGTRREKRRVATRSYSLQPNSNATTKQPREYPKWFY